MLTAYPFVWVLFFSINTGGNGFAYTGTIYAGDKKTCLEIENTVAGYFGRVHNDIACKQVMLSDRN
jgi:hypothetical protein